MDGDMISRSAMIEECRAIAAVEWNKKVAPVSWADAYEDFIEELENAPAVDAVEVVRCKDCKHYHWEQEPCHGKTVHLCDLLKAEVWRGFFCYYGLRRVEERK